jgi:hypothetical protein
VALDATVAGASADSYLTVDEADAFARTLDAITGAEWLEATLDDKERTLRAATLDVSETRAPAFSVAQALLYPRAIDAAGDPAVPFLPQSLKRATYYQAVYLLTNAEQLAANETRRARGMASFQDDDGSGSIGPYEGISRRALAALSRLRYRSSRYVYDIQIASSL